MSTITEQQTGPGLPILTLRKTRDGLTEGQAGDKEDRFVPVESLKKAVEYLKSNDAAGLIISRDRQDISPDDLVTLVQALGSSRFLLLWPPDEMMRVIRPVPSVEKEEKEGSDDPESLHTRIAILEARNASLEASMKTLVAALSQCDPWPEAYAGDENAWELIMQGIPVADLDAEDFGDTGDDEGSDEEEEYDEE
ncbi:hypothetical protein [uncultured Methanospirillum sp.]|uniref:hypothetical protein n=1 Tax=uncultured Methanospirillum sp. TaxID=262503 RepID=UPI0029C8A5BB|nr:hypothetical protein [uncultured Methanospirillum sp.]